MAWGRWASNICSTIIKLNQSEGLNPISLVEKAQRLGGLLALAKRKMGTLADQVSLLESAAIITASRK